MSKLVEIKKVDSQGRLTIPSDWRTKELSESDEVYVIKQKGQLRVIPKRNIDLRKFFDKADLGVDSIRDWNDFEAKFAFEERTSKELKAQDEDKKRRLRSS